MSDLPSCKTDIFENGVSVMVTHTLKATDVEAFVRAVATLSRQPVDWHFFGGRAVIKTTGDVVAVRATLLELRPTHDMFFRDAMSEFRFGVDDSARCLEGIWSQL